MQNAVTTAFIRRELVRLTGITGESVSRRGSRSINADAVAGYTDRASGRSAFAVADGIGDHLLAARAARTVAGVAARTAAIHGDAVLGIRAAQHDLLREFPEQEADSVLVVAVLPTAGEADGPCDIAWVGDCRAYRWNGRLLHQITTDHTVAEYFRAQGMTPSARMSHMVTTSARTVAPEAIGHAVTGASAGRLLLATDGVHKILGIGEVKSALATAGSAGAVADGLVTLALRAGGTDNATALVIDVAPPVAI